MRLQVSSPKPGRRARGEGTNKVSVRQGRGHAGALPTALRADRVQATLCEVGRGSYGEALDADQGGLRQLRAAVEVAQGVRPKRCEC